MTWRLTALAPLLAVLLLLGPGGNLAFAQDEPAPVAEETAAEPAAEEAEAPVEINEAAFAIDNFYLFVCAALVLFMQAGFAILEAGLNSSKHTVNILFKNTLDMAVGGLIYFVIGYHLMYPSGTPLVENYVGSINPAIAGTLTESGTPGATTDDAVAGALTDQVDFFYQVAFAATAATIVSGAVAGRMKFGAYMIYSAFISALIYPTIGYWKWGLGWLHQMGFYDFAGSGVVHMTGGFAGLAGAILLGPRIGRYNSSGKPISMPGHSLPLATLGVFILMIGWFGFNGGSQLKVYGAANTHAVMLIAVNTLLAACAGGVISTFVSWLLFSKPDLSMALNGVLGGLVGITANCDGVSNLSAIVIGAVAGAVVVGAIIMLDKLRIDDPVGAFPVHGVCGMWGLIACSLFGSKTYWGHVDAVETNPVFGNITAQLTGLVAIGGFAFVSMFALFALLKAVGFLRVSPEEEEKGLDISEHGMSAYAA
ncbi:MAG: ammonium transporter [Planctomycetaceae bacterium]|nr:ammonium transporter [Planctomycetaceae bacterium]